MNTAGAGLTPVPTAALRTLLRAVHHAEIPLPLTIEGLTRFGLQYCATDILHHLRGVGAETARAVLVAVLAERAAAERAAHGG
jgi:hypothetical protein